MISGKKSSSGGSVFKAWDSERGATLAVKKIKLEDVANGIPSALLREVGVRRRGVHASD